MSRRDFVLIAAVLRRASADPALDRETVETVARSFVPELQKTNERFDGERFLNAALTPQAVSTNGDRIITRFVADDFPLTERERASLDVEDCRRLEDRFLDGLLHWDEAAEAAVEVWRDSK